MLSKSICKGCQELCNSFYNFKNRCLETDRTLKNLERKMKLKLSELMKIEESEIEEILIEQPVCESQDTIESEIVDFEEYEALEEVPTEIIEEKLETEYYEEEELFDDQDSFDLQNSFCKEELIELEEVQVQDSNQADPETEFDGASSFSCTNCDFVFEEADERQDETIEKKIQKHLSAHDEGRNYCCMICGELFLTFKNLTQHQNRSHNLSDLLICQLCYVEFDSLESVESHKQNCTNTPEPSKIKKKYKPYASNKSFKCYICNGELN